MEKIWLIPSLLKNTHGVKLPLIQNDDDIMNDENF